MNGTVATAQRVLRQLSHDRRSVAIVVVLPSILLVLFRYVFDGSPVVFDRVGPQMLGIFPFVVMFLVTSVTMVRERTSGTLERLMTTPLRRGELIAGYALAFGAAALVQALVSSAVARSLGLGTGWAVVLLAVVDAILGTALGLFFSAFARTEFQAVQFMPAVVIPQLLLCGLIAPRERMADVLDWISTVLPLTWATDAFTESLTTSGMNAVMWRDLAILVGFVALAVAGAALTLRRRTP